VTEQGDLPAERLAALVDRLIESAGRDEARILRLLHESLPAAALTAKPATWLNDGSSKVLRIGTPN
jgi:hypothetical protein